MENKEEDPWKKKEERHAIEDEDRERQDTEQKIKEVYRNYFENLLGKDSIEESLEFNDAEETVSTIISVLKLISEKAFQYK